MSKRSLAWIVLALIGALSLAGMLWSSLGKSQVTFTEAELQARLNHALPRTIKTITIAGVTLNITDDRLALRIDASANVLHHDVSAIVSAHGVPRYDTHREALYFDIDDVKIIRLTVGGKTILEDDAGTRNRLTEAVGPTVQRLIESAVKTYLDTIPIYHLKNDLKGFALKAALSDVKIEHNVLVMTFSLWTLTTTVALLALPLVIVLLLVYLMIRDPLWGAMMIGDAVTAENIFLVPVAIGVHVIGKLVSMTEDKAKKRQERQDQQDTKTPES